MYIDPWEQYQSEPSSPVGWQSALENQQNTQRDFYAIREDGEAEENAASGRTERTVLGEEGRAEDRKTEPEKEHQKREEGQKKSDGFFRPLAGVGLERTYVRRDEGDADGAQANVNGDVLLQRSSLPQPYDRSTSLSNSSTASVLGGLYSQSTQSSNHTNISISSLPSSPYSQQPNGTFGPHDTEAIYHNPWKRDQVFDESFDNNADVGDGALISQHVSVPLEDGVQSHETTSTPFGNTISTWQSSPYSYVQSGQIGGPSDMTARRSNGTRIYQNVRSVSDTLWRNPNRKENTEMAATMAFTSPIIDMPHVVYESLPSLPSPSPSPKKVMISKAQTTKAELSKTTTAKKKSEAKKVTAEAETPKLKAPALSRDEEHKSHVDKLTFFETSSKCWSGTGQKCDVKSSALSAGMKTQLNDAKLLGFGGGGTVHRVTLSGIPLARKGINVGMPTQLDDIRTEVDHVKSLSGHKHIVQLVGTYIDDTHPSYDTFYILTFPVADCDMSNFLAEYEKSLETSDSDTITKLCNAAGITTINVRYTPPSALLRQFLKQTLGCITAAIAFMHNHKISHDDIKPANILFRSGCVYITDFGISRNRQLATQTSTELNPGRTLGWSAPEKDEAERHNPFQADVYSFGCIFMHVISLLSGKKKTKDCALILHNYPVHREPGILRHFQELAEAQWTDGTSWEGSMKIMALTMQMLSNDRHARPKIEDVNRRLVEIGGVERRFHNVCCLMDTSLAEVKFKAVPQVPRPPTPRSEAATISKSNNHTIRPPPKHISSAPGLEKNLDRMKPLPSAEGNDKTVRPLPKSAPHW